ncbi:hypothetical protein SJX93_17285 [Streptomyces cyaneofuscatus]|uniref:hypothetical protein n=1 Tax=Streptomyces cyaneofuscatus TaxID=66883 RepID=UPI002D7726A8|nr:hypothetical protein [Streptomyces cyaneofuscatus]WRO14961.1 hypothetical protein SJX93_17285 [Streptomyces cyaneofuscatus]
MIFQSNWGLTTWTSAITMKKHNIAVFIADLSIMRATPQLLKSAHTSGAGLTGSGRAVPCALGFAEESSPLTVDPEVASGEVVQCSTRSRRSAVFLFHQAPELSELAGLTPCSPAPILHSFRAFRAARCGTVGQLTIRAFQRPRRGISMRFRAVAASAALVLLAMTGTAACSSSSGAAETPQPPAGPAASVKSAPVEGVVGRVETGKRAGVPTLDGQSVVGPSECAVPVEEIPVECALDLSFDEISVGESAGDVPDAQ